MAARIILDYAPKQRRGPRLIDLSIWLFSALSIVAGLIGILGVFAFTILIIDRRLRDESPLWYWLVDVTISSTAFFFSAFTANSARRRIREKRSY